MKTADSNFSKIIIVDDDITNLTVAKNALTDRYIVYTAPSGAKLFQLLEKLTPDLILLDIEMPEMNGYEVIKNLKKKEKTTDIPVIFLTTIIDPLSEVKGLSLGAIDYITKPFSRELLLKRIELHLLVAEQRKELKDYSEGLEKMLSKKSKAVFGLQNAILKTVAELVESRDNITGGHIERTQEYLTMFVNLLFKNGIYIDVISKWDINLFIMSSQLHDVGKIAIKDSILMKPGKLTKDEFNEMKKHTIYGIDIIKKIEVSTPESVFLKHAEIMAGSHHEKWDGSGYPNGIAGENIPLQGRLMAIVDVYDALTNLRPYKEKFSHEDSMEIIKHGREKHFDPVITDIFLRYEKEFKRVVDKICFISDRDFMNIEEKKGPESLGDLMDARTGMESNYSDKLQQNLRILINALKDHDRYREALASWDIDVFLMSAQLYNIEKIATIGSHHEKWDGSGYPLALKGNEIPLQGRLTAIVDVYSALTCDRPDRGKLSHREAVEIIKSNSGTSFDPRLVSVFLEYEKEFEKAGS